MMAASPKQKTPLHLRLTCDEWLKTFNQLDRAELGVFYYIKTQDPFGDRVVEANSNSLAALLGIHRTSVSRALKSLSQKGLIDSRYAQTYNVCLEFEVRDRLHKELGGQTEVATTVGRIDLLTELQVIEVKNVNEWKQALGQVLAYGAFFPEHSKRIHLFGKQDIAKIALIQATCSEFGVEISFEEVNDDK